MMCYFNVIFLSFFVLLLCDGVKKYFPPSQMQQRGSFVAGVASNETTGRRQTHVIMCHFIRKVKTHFNIL